MTVAPLPSVSLQPLDRLVERHIGPRAGDIAAMLATLGFESLAELVAAVIPDSIRTREPLGIGPARGEQEVLAELRAIAGRNRVARSYIGMGYYGCHTPPVIQRNILENPAWYTQYTPYQSEIAQGRLEALLNFQTMVSDLTALPIANASLLDEATAAWEAAVMCRAIANPGRGESTRNRFLVDRGCHPQTIALLKARADAVGMRIEVGAVDQMELAADVCGVLVQYPATDGAVEDYAPLTGRVHDAGALVACATDLLALTLLRPPGEWGADIAIGSSQRFGVPMGYGGPHAAFLATREEFKRQLPGRLVGVSRDAAGKPALRLALQTREQHIRRDRATSNICTAQVLLAVMASMYAIYHGPQGLKAIALRTHRFTAALAAGLRRLGHTIDPGPVFDTLRVRLDPEAQARRLSRAAGAGINLRIWHDGSLGVSLDETVTLDDLSVLLWIFAADGEVPPDAAELVGAADDLIPDALARTSPFLTHPVFETHHSEHEMLRYIHRLQSRDLSLVHSMIPLGSCTMKLNATAEMLPITWPEIANLHPFCPSEQAEGYGVLVRQLEQWLASITGFAATSLQPNAGSQGEYAGLMAIRAWHASRGEGRRNVCLIPVSAHGTNPASAVMAGFRVVPVACDDQGNIDLADLQARAEEHAERLGAIMITYPSTHGVFEESVREVCAVIHRHGGQVYLDGANINAQVGLCRPGEYGADVCHLNLHKTFCIPHGGGGPGVGPICVAAHLAPFLPGHPFTAGEGSAVGPVSAAPQGSAGILPIAWMYIALMGDEGLTRASEVALLNANYMANRLREHYPLLFTNRKGRVAHEFILDLRPLKKSAGIDPEDVAKRLIDYGFHAPTMSWPVAGTLMIEPTESEPRAELDRFCDAMIAIRQEIREIEEGRADRENNLLKNAPHSIQAVAADEWPHPYSRERAVYPAPWLREAKFWPAVGRVDNAWGDRNVVCTCPPVEAWEG